MEYSKPIQRRGRLSGTQRIKLRGLLNMMYTPAELADVIGESRRQFYRVYIPLGCPHERQANGRIFINGKAFRAWYEDTYWMPPLGPDEAFCKTCYTPVKMQDPSQSKGKDCTLAFSRCPKCGRKIARILTRSKHHD